MDIFCKIINGELPSYTIYENEYVKCIMDANPDKPGHTLIIPKRHYTTTLDLDEKIIIEIHNASKIIINAMEASLPNISGVRIGINYGEYQIVKHYHMHIVPSYKNGVSPSLSKEEICELLKEKIEEEK